MKPYRFAKFVLVLLFGFCIACTKKKAVEDYTMIDPSTLTKGDTITPFRYINPKDHDWRVVIRVSGEDLVDVSHKLTTRMFSTTDPDVLERIRKWRFIYKRDGVMDASSTVRIFKNDELEETYGIVLEKKWVGLQSKKLGLIQSVNHDELLEIIREMD